MNSSETIVAGGGMAGLSTAIFLNRAGRDVLVLERDETPRFKPCAGGVTPRAMLLARRLNVDLGALHATYVMENNSPPWHYNRFQAKLPVMAVADRQAIDQSLLEAALREGVQVRTAKVRNVDFSRGKFHVRTDRGEFHSPILVGADGAASLVRRAFGSRVPYFARAIMHRRIESSQYQDRIVFDGGYVQGGYGWIFPTGEDSANAGVYVINRCKGRNLRSVLDAYARDRFGAPRISGPVTGSVIPWGGHTRPAPGAPLLLVGDAGGFADPLTGEGIFQALYTARVAADAIIHSNNRTVRRAYYRRLLPMRANVELLRILCPVAHTPYGARMGGRVLSRSMVHGPIAEGLLRGFNTSVIGAAYPALLGAWMLDPKITRHDRRSYISLADHAQKPF